MTEVVSYLKNYREEVPAWIDKCLRGEPVSFGDVMSSRMGYYPGSGYDGTLMKVCNMAHCVHSFLYVDYLITRTMMEQHIAQPRSINGYHIARRIEWTAADLLPHGQYPLTTLKRPRSNPMTFVDRNVKPYCFTLIMERNENQDDSRGAPHFAITFLFADGIATYYQLFVREYAVAPWIFLLQDHGFGCNYDLFGRGGLLDAIIRENRCYPTFVLCGDNTRIWNGYEPVKETSPINERHHHTRSLFGLKSTVLQ